MDITNLIDCMTPNEPIDFTQNSNTNDYPEINQYPNLEADIPEEDIPEDKDDNLEDDNLEEDDESNEYSLENRQVCIHYNEDEEIYNEELANDYHCNKSFGNWHTAKMIVAHSYANSYTEFLWDYLNIQFQENNDDFNNIIKVYYKNNLDIEIIYEFETVIAKYLVDNIKIQSFKPRGYLFNSDENQNKWEFKIVVITSKGIYCANRYITDNVIGCY